MAKALIRRPAIAGGGCGCVWDVVSCHGGMFWCGYVIGDPRGGAGSHTR